MDITTLKSSLNILDVATALDISIDAKTKRAICPFHDDKTPSLQFSAEKQICTCFSTNCNAGTMDVIGLVEKKLKVSTHEALKYLENVVSPATAKTVEKPLQVEERPDYVKDFEQMQSSFLASKVAREYAKSRNLDASRLAIGYNAFKNSKFSYLRGCITFPLVDEEGKVVSLYGRSVRDNDKSKHYYSSKRRGVYPSFPIPFSLVYLPLIVMLSTSVITNYIIV